MGSGVGFGLGISLRVPPPEELVVPEGARRRHQHGAWAQEWLCGSLSSCRATAYPKLCTAWPRALLVLARAKARAITIAWQMWERRPGA